MKILYLLSRWPVILVSFVVMNLTGFAFGYVQQAVGGELLDMIGNGEQAKARLLEMTQEQKSAHFKATVFLDTLYPLAYGSFFIGLTARLSEMKNLWLIVPALSAMFFDFLENTVQAIALFGNPEALNVKTIASPLKFGSVILAMIIALSLILFAGYRKLSKPRRQPTDSDQ